MTLLLHNIILHYIKVPNIPTIFDILYCLDKGFDNIAGGLSHRDKRMEGYFLFLIDILIKRQYNSSGKCLFSVQ